MTETSTIPAERGGGSPWSLGAPARNAAVFASFLIAMLIAIANTPYFFAQSAPITLVLLALFGCIESRPRPSLRSLTLASKPAPVLWLALAMSVLVTLSSLWAPEPLSTLEKGVLVAIVITSALAATRIFDSEHRTHLQWIASGIVIGIAIGLVVVAINVFTREAITRWVLWNVPVMQGRAFQAGKYYPGENSIQFLAESFSNRAQTVAVILLIPTVAIARFHASSWARTTLLAAATPAGVAILIYGFHESSKLALLVAGLAYLIGQLDIRALRATVVVGWCTAVALMPLIAWGLSASGLDKAPWLLETAQTRIVIWRTTVERLRDTPILGIGAAGAEQLHRRTPDARWVQGTPFPNTTARHAHNAYLQVWFELGAIGAALMLALGLALITAIGRLPLQLQTFGLVQFSLSAAMILASYGIWQIWFLSSFAIGTALLAALARASERSEARRP